MNTIKEKISVIVPIYNAESYLQKCIESILNQTYSNIQIILIDDGSIDESGNICDVYSKRDSRVEVYHTENHGLVAARKLGLKISTGQYIGFVDSDDYIESTTFSDMINDIKKNNSDFVHFGYIEENYKDSILLFNLYNAVFEMKDKYERINFLSNHVLKQMDISPSIWSKLFKADFIKKCYNNVLDNQQYGEDMICLFYCILEANRISLSKKTRYHYVVREKSLSHLDDRSYIINEVKLWSQILSVLDRYKCENIIQESVFCFLKERIFNSAKQISKRRICMQRYYYTDLKKLYNKKIVIYGAGTVGQDYYEQISQFDKCKIVAWVDQQWYKKSSEHFKIVGIEKIRNLEYDMIIIALEDDRIREDIKNSLISEGCSEIKIYGQKPGIYYE